MRSRWQRALALAAWAGCVGVLAWCLARPDHGRTAQAIPLEAPADDDGSLPSRGGPPIPTDSRRTVPAGQSLVLSLVPGVVAELEPGALFSVGKLTVRKTGVTVEERSARLDLIAGRGFFDVSLPPDRQAALAVTTPLGTAEAEPGTAFSVDTGGAAGRVTCAWGSVRWQPAHSLPEGKPLVLVRGQTWNNAGPAMPSSAAVRAVAEVPQAQEDLAALLRFGPRVKALQAQRRGEVSFLMLKSR